MDWKFGNHHTILLLTVNTDWRELIPLQCLLELGAIFVDEHLVVAIPKNKI